MNGGSGDDVYFIDSSTAGIVEANLGGVDSVFASVDYVLSVEVESLTLTGAASINGTGNSSANTITGTVGDNVLSGGSGNDLLIGSTGTGNAVGNLILGNSGDNRLTGLGGDDTLTGGDGADRFIFNSTVSGTDTISDFNGLVSGLADGDKLQFTGLLVGGFDYVGSAGFSGGSDNTEARVLSGGRLVIDADGDGAGDITILLTGLTDAAQLTITDFQFG